MKLPKQHAKHLLPIAIVLTCSFLWSWLWIVNVGHLADQPIVAYVTIFFSFSIIVGLSAAIFLQTIRYLQKSYKKKVGWTWLLKAIVIWALAEAVAAWLAAFVWMGKNGSIDNIFPFSSLTPFLMYTPLRFLSRFVGFYGLSAITVIGSTTLLFKKLHRFAIYYWLAVIVLTFAAWKLYQTPNKAPLKATIVAETLEDKVSVRPADSMLIVLPEYGLDTPVDANAPPRILPSSQNYYFVGSRQTPAINGHTNVLIFGSRDQGETNFQPKNRLIAGGEYLPYGVDTLTQLFAKTTNSDFQVRRAVVRGTKPIYPDRISNDLVVGAGVCSSIMTPRDYRELTKNGSTVLTNSASLEIFEGSRVFAWQHRGLATFMAVANARPFLQSTNHWPAFALDQNGHMLGKTEPVSQTQVTVRPNSAKTPYTWLGEWVAIVGGLVVAADFVRERRSKKA